MIYTSYFANRYKFPQNAKIISIARYAPIYFKGTCWDVLAPSKELLYQYKYSGIDEEEYTNQYLKELQQRNKEAVRQALWQLEDQYGNVILCCYEKKNNFCHRHILAEWLDIGIKEL